jgi:glutaredoxin-related protein
MHRISKNIAVGSELFEAAFYTTRRILACYVSFYLMLISRSKEFAQQCDESAVWSQLAQAYINKSLVKGTIGIHYYLYHKTS